MTARKTKATEAKSIPTPERILRSAEQLFSARGIDGVSLREITSDAGVNSASAHYHFGSKNAVLEALFTLRARPIIERREEMLAQLKLDRYGRPVLEDVLRAFLQPALDLLNSPDGATFTLLRARMVLERGDAKLKVMTRTFDRTNVKTLKMLAKALPKLPQKDLYWRFHFLLATMVYTMAQPGRIESVTKGQIKTSDTDSALEQLIRFAAAGFRAA
jgi:AcrR family transcriptional regulator